VAQQRIGFANKNDKVIAHALPSVFNTLAVKDVYGCPSQRILDMQRMSKDDPTNKSTDIPLSK